MRIIFFCLLISTIGNAQLPDLSRGANEVYGAHCGIVGTHPPSRVMIENWIANDQFEDILGWLYSPNNVKTVYAAEAILRMQVSGTEVAPEDSKHIEEMRQSEIIIPTCSGCIYQERKIEDIFIDLDRLIKDGNPRPPDKTNR